MNQIPLFIRKCTDLASSSCWLKRMAYRYADLCGLSLPQKLVLTRRSSGKPFFANAPDVEFSLSHSGNYLVAAFAGHGVGVDLQEHRSCQDQAIARRFFHPDEVAYLEKHPDSFYRIWCAKESYVKFTEEGISANFPRFSVVEGDEFIPPKAELNFSFPFFRYDYTLCLCAACPIVTELIPG